MDSSDPGNTPVTLEITPNELAILCYMLALLGMKNQDFALELIANYPMPNAGKLFMSASAKISNRLDQARVDLFGGEALPPIDENDPSISLLDEHGEEGPIKW